tara:strand:- start:83 stop:562 length:480 start_codon:yes stop_codon:yes gene_type:complete
MADKRLDTKLFSNGAEFLVMAKLLLANIQTYKAYVNFEGYDLVCVNPKKNLSAKIQVKSKNFVGDSSFYLNSPDKNKSDFYVFAQTNSIKKINKINTLMFDLEPKLYIMDYKTVDKIKKIDKKGTHYLSLSKNQIPNIDEYESNWSSIKKFLELPITHL